MTVIKVIANTIRDDNYLLAMIEIIANIFKFYLLFLKNISNKIDYY